VSADLGPVDLLAFGPHPDDIEIGMAATIAKHTLLGYAAGLCDLTQGELGSNGTPAERVAEAEAAARVLGAAWRVNLGLPDGGLVEDDGHVRSIASVIRRCRPAAIAVPYGGDRHPDHVKAHTLLQAAIFKAGLRRYDTGEPAWQAEWTCAYFINDAVAPSFVVDVSDCYERKRRALACHVTQFQPAGVDMTPTRLTSPLFLQRVESRDAQFGALAGVRFAEGFHVREPVLRPLLVGRWPEAARRS
jgi:bacillithiol biosynthesis deacetylase BshB1